MTAKVAQTASSVYVQRSEIQIPHERAAPAGF
jgi:hypothetical protein